MTALEVYRETPAVAVVPDRAEVATRRLGEWAESASAAFEVAKGLVQTSFVPEAFRGKPYEATGAILAGLEVGLSPMAALRSFDIINGTAAPRANTLRAVVQAHGHELVLVESTTTRCKMRGKRRGSTEWQEVTWTIDRAKQLGVTTKANWQKQPQAMLVARATGELARLVASDAILGIGYAVEELDDGEAEATSTSSRATKRTAKRAAPVAPVPDAEPSLEPEQPVEHEEPLPAAATDDPITKPQMAKMHASFNDLGITERDERLRITRGIVGRDDLDTANDLSKAEAMTLLDVLEECAASGDHAALYSAAGLVDEPPDS